jgi:muconolactone delta-isomerase
MNSALASTPQLQRQRQASPGLWPAFTLSALTAITLFFVPFFIIHPFRYQAPRALLLAMAFRQRAPLGTLVAALACLALATVLWRTTGRWRKVLIAVTLIVVAFSAVMARLNHFEWMFHPITDAQFQPQSASKLDPKEMIMAVNLAGEARAYPISQMAYHHILNDVVGGVPIAVTY